MIAADGGGSELDDFVAAVGGSSGGATVTTRTLCVLLSQPSRAMVEVALVGVDRDLLEGCIGVARGGRRRSGICVGGWRGWKGGLGLTVVARGRSVIGTAESIRWLWSNQAQVAAMGKVATNSLAGCWMAPMWADALVVAMVLVVAAKARTFPSAWVSVGVEEQHEAIGVVLGALCSFGHRRRAANSGRRCNREFQHGLLSDGAGVMGGNFGGGRSGEGWFRSWGGGRGGRWAVGVVGGGGGSGVGANGLLGWFPVSFIEELEVGLLGFKAVGGDVAEERHSFGLSCLCVHVELIEGSIGRGVAFIELMLLDELAKIRGEFTEEFAVEVEIPLGYQVGRQAAILLLEQFMEFSWGGGNTLGVVGAGGGVESDGANGVGGG